MLKRVLCFAIAGFFVSAVLQVSPVRADDVVVLGVRTENSACNTAFGIGANCFVSNGKITAATDGTKVEAINPIMAYVGETIKITNQSGSHNMIFCKAGTVIPNNGGDASKDWICGDPISLTGGPDPECCQTASGPNAPQMIGYHPVETYPFSTTLNTAGDYYFWCGIGGHRKEGQYGKLVVKSGSRPTVETSPPSTNKAPSVSDSTEPTTNKAPSVSDSTEPTTNKTPATAEQKAPTSSTLATSTTVSKAGPTPTLVLRKSGTRLTATGRATPGGRVILQKQSGTRWVAVGSATVGKAGTYTITSRAEAKITTYRVVVGLRASATRRM